MLKLLRILSVLEGISLLAILSVTFGFISRDYVFSIGMTHGVLFMLYCFFVLAISNVKNWPSTVTPILLFASLLPFAFIGVEYFLRKASTNEELCEQP